MRVSGSGAFWEEACLFSEVEGDWKKNVKQAIYFKKNKKYFPLINLIFINIRIKSIKVNKFKASDLISIYWRRNVGLRNKILWLMKWSFQEKKFKFKE